MPIILSRRQALASTSYVHTSTRSPVALSYVHLTRLGLRPLGFSDRDDILRASYTMESRIDSLDELARALADTLLDPSAKTATERNEKRNQAHKALMLVLDAINAQAHASEAYCGVFCASASEPTGDSQPTESEGKGSAEHI